ncbi:MAG: hypothetical protein ABL997_05310 [Planctomycetota bacterium]
MTSSAAWPRLLLVVAALAAATACAFWPLAVYGVTLALFGVPHALVELQWVGRRYGSWRTLAPFVVGGLALVALARIASLSFGWEATTAATFELGLGMVLVALVLPRDLRRCGLRCGMALAVLLVLGIGVAASPIDALLVLAIAHNLTPAGFVADRLRDGDSRPGERVRYAAAGLLAFVALPVWLATGSAASLLGLESAHSTADDLVVGGTLGLGLFDGLLAFTPSFVPPSRSLDLLRAVAFLQVVHYVAVLLVMPRLGARPASERRAPSSPPRLAFPALVLFLGLVFATAFVVDFREAKATYGVLAAVHVWLEFPALLLALTPRALVPAVS